MDHAHRDGKGSIPALMYADDRAKIPTRFSYQYIFLQLDPFVASAAIQVILIGDNESLGRDSLYRPRTKLRFLCVMVRVLQMGI